MHASRSSKSTLSRLASLLQSTATVAAAIAVAVPVPHGGGPGPAAPAPTLAAVRQVGQSGHAGLYAWGVGAFTDGSLLIGDYNNHQVVHYGKDGTYLGILVPPGSSHASPYGIAVDPTNNDFYFGDVDGGVDVDKYDSHGNLLLQFGGPSEFVYPGYLAVASDRNVVVVDSRGNKIAIHRPDGSLVRTFGTAGSGPLQFNTPRGVAIDASDRIFVVDVNNARIQVMTETGTFVASWPVPTGSYRGLAIDKADGWLYLVHDSANTVLKYDLTGHLLAQWGSKGSGPGQFINGGRDVAVDDDGNVWVGDMPNFRIQKFTSTGTFLLAEPNPPQPPPPGGFNQPDGVALDAAGDVFVVDTYNWRVEKFSPSGVFLQQWGQRGNGQFGFNYPRGIGVDRTDGSVIVADTDGANLDKYSNTGAFVWQVKNLVKSRALVVGPDGTIYVADGQHQRVAVFSSGGALLYTFGSAGTGQGQFKSDDGIALDSDGTLWVSDSARNVVQHFTGTGAYLGQFGGPGSGDANFSAAVGVALDSKYVYVVDRSANKIKVWTRSGSFVEAFGAGGSTLGRFNAPQGATLGPDGHLYVVESGNERVQDIAITK